MGYISLIFLWATAAVAVPIIIALWNRKHHKKEVFGAYFLLKRVAESTKKRIQILQLLKLLNRIAMFILICLVFAEPVVNELRLKEAANGFSVIIDAGRVMQAKDERGKRLVTHQFERLTEILEKIPSNAQGSILFASSRCEAYQRESGRLTATASEWLDELELSQISYVNEPTTISGVNQCYQRAQSIFSNKEILQVFISPLPNSIDEQALAQLNLQVEKTAEPGEVEKDDFKITQEVRPGSVRVYFDWKEPRELFLIQSDGRLEALGRVENFVDLVPSNQTWLWVKGESSVDPWAGSRLVPIKAVLSKKITLWAAEESEGYLSLLAALRSHEQIQVVRQIGGNPVGDIVIVYGSYPYSLEGLDKAWFFVSPSEESPFRVRDKKQWTAANLSSDLKRAFQMKTQDGTIFVKSYVLFDLDFFSVLESFEDGAPSLLELRNPDRKVWVTPFDLEDLTTDLSLEPTFIPYLFRRLENWLGQDAESGDPAQLRSVWSMPGAVQPTSSTLARRQWPGVYASESQSELIQPTEFPSSFFKIDQTQKEAELEEEEVSLRSEIITYLGISVFIELALCLLSTKFSFFGFLAALMFFGSVGNSLQAQTNPWGIQNPFFRQRLQGMIGDQKINMAVLPGIDKDRHEALKQFSSDISRLSNLDFETPEVVKYDEMWKNALIFMSSSKPIQDFTPRQREQIRSYLDRGGLIVFDDPLAARDTPFYKSVVEQFSKILPGRSFKPIDKDNVLFRTFYLLKEVSGRRLSSPFIEGIELDGRWVVLFSINDLLGAVLRSSGGDYAFSVAPYGIMQRRLSQRLLLNIFMYSVTVDYKDDAIHLPHILKRRVR